MQERFWQNRGSGKYCVGKIWCSHGSSPSPLIFGEYLKISDHNNWSGEDLSKKKKNFEGGGAKFKGEPKILGTGGGMNPNDVMVVVLKDIVLYLLGGRSIYIVSIS